MFKQISGNEVSFSFNEYDSGESFCIMYKSLKNSELLDLIEKDEIIYLSKYKDGDKLKYQFEQYIYNDTDKDITVNTKNTVFGIEDSNSVVIGKGEIYGFDWMIDSATITYSQANNNGNQNNNNANNQNQQQTEDNDNSKKIVNSKDNTVVKSSKLPQTGTPNFMIIMILSSTIIMIIIGIKSRKFKDIK